MKKAAELMFAPPFLWTRHAPLTELRERMSRQFPERIPCAQGRPVGACFWSDMVSYLLEDAVKAKLSVTLDESLVAFVDAEPGETRSEKIESVLRRYRAVQRELKLREQLAAFSATESDDSETDAWRRVMQEAMWRESGAAKSGRSLSRRSRSRGRR